MKKNLTTKVLVVDDDAVISHLLNSTLQTEGYEVIEARNGREGLELARKTLPDLVILDVMMPQLDGWEVLKQMRLDPALALTPVIFLTALSSLQHQLHGFRLGADEYLSKPFKTHQLAACLRKTLERHQVLKEGLLSHLKANSSEGGGARKGERGSTLEGDFEQIGLSSLMYLLEQEQRSGLLEIENYQGQAAELWVRMGEILAAESSTNPDLQGEELIYEVLSWMEGRFRFSAQSVAREQNIHQSTMHLILEGARRYDEKQRS